jgi:hypothetical protein
MVRIWLWWAALCGCTGEVDVHLVDTSPAAPGGEVDLLVFQLPFDHVEARRDGEWEPLARGPDPYNPLDFSGKPILVDLLSLREAPLRVVHDEVPVGALTALRLVLTDGEPITLQTVDGIVHPVTAPDVVEWEVAMEVERDGTEARTFDLRVRDALVAVEAGAYHFDPALLPAD